MVVRTTTTKSSPSSSSSSSSRSRTRTTRRIWSSSSPKTTTLIVYIFVIVSCVGIVKFHNEKLSFGTNNDYYTSVQSAFSFLPTTISTTKTTSTPSSLSPTTFNVTFWISVTRSESYIIDELRKNMMKTNDHQNLFVTLVDSQTSLQYLLLPAGGGVNYQLQFCYTGTTMMDYPSCPVPPKKTSLQDDDDSDDDDDDDDTELFQVPLTISSSSSSSSLGSPATTTTSANKATSTNTIEFNSIRIYIKNISTTTWDRFQKKYKKKFRHKKENDDDEDGEDDEEKKKKEELKSMNNILKTTFVRSIHSISYRLDDDTDTDTDPTTTTESATTNTTTTTTTSTIFLDDITAAQRH